MKRWVVALLAAVVMVGAGCAVDEDSRVNRQERRQFHIVMESKLKQLDRGIVQLDDVSQHDSAYASDVQKLKDSLLALHGKLDALNSASNEEWAALRDSVEDYYHGVRSHYAELMNRATMVGAATYAPAPVADSSTVTARGGTR